MPFRLSAVIMGHKKDVRCVCPLNDGSNRIVSGSRDGSAKLWTFQESSDSGSGDVARQWHCSMTFSGHQGFVSAVTARAPDDSCPNGLVYTGCQDGAIRVFDPSKPEPIQTLLGHSANVVSLFLSKAHTLLSGSWDHTARVWLNDREVLKLEGHTMGVWAGIVLPETGIMVTGSADKTIRLWKAGRGIKVIEHHTQSVRDLAVVSSTEFLSCANDQTILLHKITDEVKCTVEVIFRYDDADYLYSLAVRSPAAGWVAGGEHIGLRVFDSNGKVGDHLAVPTSSVWSTCVLANGDIAAACSDAKIYIFTEDPTRAAPHDLQSVFMAEVERFIHGLTNGASGSKGPSTLPEEIGGIKVADLPGPDALQFPGKADGATKMIKDGNNISVYSWSQASCEWSKVGDMITDPDKSGETSHSKKVTYEGKEYDHVFSIDIDDNVVLKLPYNNDQDPYQVAQKFIHDNELPQGYLDEIANFIFKNASNAAQAPGLGQACDPFTGSGAYVSGSGGVPTAKDYGSGNVGVAADPFTGSGAYVSGSGGVPTAKDYAAKPGVALDPFTGSGAYVSSPDTTENTFFPMTTYLSFSQMPKMAALVSKLSEFNLKIAEDLRLYDQDVTRLTELPTAETADFSDIALLIRALKWPSANVFPCLDIARMAVLNPNFSQCLTSVDEMVTDFMESVIRNLRDKSNPTNQMLALRVMVNTFSSPNGVALMSKLKSFVFTEVLTVLPNDNKNIQIGLSTVFLNCSVMSTLSSDTEAANQCLTILEILMEAVNDAEAKFRTLVTLGTLMSFSAEVRGAARELLTHVRTWKEVGGSEKLVNCAQFILNM